ncbi:sulfurtransferase complex subunit TusC [Marinobacter fonticola]|uniref:sulfurtransferase complex subunit TusC n=1 Tax=Marinobacter fonticola TaxID=2603215 RepID=UPI0011E71073|nr:sulfurtransferase complex subunit TusC [Marinobacter fonticola]
MTRRYLFVIDRAPYGDWSGREALDMAFSAAAFDQPVALLFTGAGVQWLRDQQQPAAIEQKTVSRNLSAASLFGIEALYADQASLDRFKLAQSEPSLEISTIGSIREVENQFTDVVRL